MNRDATDIAARNSVKELPRIATIALAVTPAGLLMQIIYFFACGRVEFAIRSDAIPLARPGA